MCVGDRNSGTFEEILAFFLCKELLPMAWITWEHKLFPVAGRLLGSDTLRADTHITGLVLYLDGLSLSVKGQNRDGTVDEKIPKFLHYEIPSYPNPVVAWFAGSHWFTDRGNEYFQLAKQMECGLEKLVKAIRGTDALIEFLRDLARREMEAREDVPTEALCKAPLKQPRLFD